MKKYILSLIIMVGLSSISCQKKKDIALVETNNDQFKSFDSAFIKQQDSTGVRHIGDNSQVSVDWEGTYEATLPCADCPGIKSVLTLKSDHTFILSEEYLERNVKIEDSGSFKWDKNGQKIQMNGKESKNSYLVGENQLFHLDSEGNIINGPLKEFFIYKKRSSE